MRNTTNNSNVVTIPTGGVSFETQRNAYRGSVSVNGMRYRTKYYTSRSSALRALNQLRSQLAISLNANATRSVRSVRSSARTSR